MFWGGDLFDVFHDDTNHLMQGDESNCQMCEQLAPICLNTAAVGAEDGTRGFHRG